VTSDPVKGKDGDRSDGGDHGKKHDGDEPGGSIGCLWCGLSDSEGINEDIREIEKEFHGF